MTGSKRISLAKNKNELVRNQNGIYPQVVANFFHGFWNKQPLKEEIAEKIREWVCLRTDFFSEQFKVTVANGTSSLDTLHREKQKYKIACNIQIRF